MRAKLLIILAMILVWPNLSHAEWVHLVCVDSQDAFTLNVDFDEDQQRVRVNGGGSVNALIDGMTISFYSLASGIKWFQVINRSNGNMMIQNDATKKILPAYNCAPAKKKF